MYQILLQSVRFCRLYTKKHFMCVFSVHGIEEKFVLCVNLLFKLYLQRFVNRFEAAKAKLQEASAAVADGAVTAAQQLSTKTFRMSLDIHLKAPIIFVPRSSVSPHVLVVDLGRLTVHNSFKTVDNDEAARTSDGLPAVIDHMSVDLTDMKLSTYVPLSCVMSLMQWLHVK